MVGVFPPPVDGPCFMSPVFASGRQRYIQKIDEGGNIGDFWTPDVLTMYGDLIVKVADEEDTSWSVGDPALFAFRFSLGEIEIGPKNDIQERLRARLFSLTDHPFLCWEIAGFLGDEELRERAMDDIRRKFPMSEVTESGESISMKPRTQPQII